MLLDIFLHTMQLQSGAIYLLVLDAFHSGVVAIEKVNTPCSILKPES